MATRQEIVDTIRSGKAKVQETFGSLSEEQLQTRIHEGEHGWTAKQVLAHLAGRGMGHDRTIKLAETGELPAGFDVNQWNQQRVDERINKSRDELLAEFHRVHDALIQRVQGLSDELLAKTIPRGTGPVLLSDALRGGGGQHSINHSEEVAKVLKSG
jgi:hypothetical protein